MQNTTHNHYTALTFRCVRGPDCPSVYKLDLYIVQLSLYMRFAWVVTSGSVNMCRHNTWRVCTQGHTERSSWKMLCLVSHMDFVDLRKKDSVSRSTRNSWIIMVPLSNFRIILILKQRYLLWKWKLFLNIFLKWNMELQRHVLLLGYFHLSSLGFHSLPMP